MAVGLVETYTPELTEAMNRLVPQLSTSTPPLSEEFVEALVNQPACYLFVYRADEPDDNGERPILGMLTLATFDIPTGKRAWVEDVVVDHAARGQGAGMQLVEAAVSHAAIVGAKTVDLTSRPTRKAANRLYQRAGFELRETNVYRFKAA